METSNNSVLTLQRYVQKTNNYAIRTRKCSRNARKL